MSGDQLDLDAIAAWFEGKTEHSSLDDLSVVSEWHAVRDLIAEVRRLRAWKEEALPVMDGLQELGGALGLPLGARITGREAVDAALDLRNQAGAR